MPPKNSEIGLSGLVVFNIADIFNGNYFGIISTIFISEIKCGNSNQNYQSQK